VGRKLVFPIAHRGRESEGYSPVIVGNFQFSSATRAALRLKLFLFDAKSVIFDLVIQFFRLDIGRKLAEGIVYEDDDESNEEPAASTSI
jgi:hypothetical protein